MFMHWAGVKTLSMILVSIQIGHADVFLKTPPPVAHPIEEAEEFPESYFGSAPNPSRSASRGPASLSFAGGSPSVGNAPKPEGTLGATVASRSVVQEISLIANDSGFFPKTLFVTRNIPVRIFMTGASKRPLCMMLDSFKVRRQLRAQKVEEVEFTPTEAGQFRFYCPVNGMEGMLYVKDMSGGMEQ